METRINMRNEKEVFEQLLNFAQGSERVRAVILNGSRVNNNAPKDIFNDYDIIFAVDEPRYFLQNQNWIKNFGELTIMQQNDIDENGIEAYIFLMIFTDGVRIDLTFYPARNIHIALEDSLTKVLMDKDNIIGELEPPNDSSYFTPKPSRKEFEKTINEFWWCSTNVAKGLWRDELCYAKYMLEVIVRDCIIKMLAWHIGVKHNWGINSGKCGKWFKRYLPAELWEALEKTYAGAGYEEIWEALFEAGRLARKIGIELAEALGYEYPMEDDQRVTEYLREIYVLPKDTEAIV